MQSRSAVLTDRNTKQRLEDIRKILTDPTYKNRGSCYFRSAMYIKRLPKAEQDKHYFVLVTARQNNIPTHCIVIDKQGMIVRDSSQNSLEGTRLRNMYKPGYRVLAIKKPSEILKMEQRGTYIGLKATQHTKKLLHNRYSQLGLRDLVDDLHITLMYAEKQDVVDTYKARPDRVYDCVVTGWDILGEGKWQALVLKLRCPQLQRRHYAIRKVYGLEHGYPDLTLHVSLKYAPTSLDKDIVFSDTSIIGEKLSFNGEYVESISGD